jgi:hypothetical protein
MIRNLSRTVYNAKNLIPRRLNSSFAVGIDVISPLIGLSGDQQVYYTLARTFADNEMKPYAG